MLVKKAIPSKSRNLKGIVRNLTPAQYLESNVAPARLNRIVSFRSENNNPEAQLSTVKVMKSGYSPI
jgi:hypothetical protein